MNESEKYPKEIPEKKSKWYSGLTGEKFSNPWNKDKCPWEGGSFSRINRAYIFTKWIYNLKTKTFKNVDYEKDLPVYSQNFENPKELNSTLKATWLGHASVLVEIDGFKILFDPVFGDKVPPIVGPARYRPCPCDVIDLPEDLDAVVISHNHYDHMDEPTLIEINKKFDKIKWFVPKGDTLNISYVNNENIKELSWWEDETISKDGSELKLVFTPTQHWSNRGATDICKSLWGSWVLIGPKHRFWFGGDTGYCITFKAIGYYYGPFDMAAIPIGAYEPRDMMEYQHVSPKESVLIHQDIKSKYSFGIHWGTFILTNEEILDPREDLKKAVEENNKKREDFNKAFEKVNKKREDLNKAVEKKEDLKKTLEEANKINKDLNLIEEEVNKINTDYILVLEEANKIKEDLNLTKEESNADRLDKINFVTIHHGATLYLDKDSKEYKIYYDEDLRIRQDSTVATVKQSSFLGSFKGLLSGRRYSNENDYEIKNNEN